MLKGWPTSKLDEVAQEYFRWKHNQVLCPAKSTDEEIALARSVNTPFIYHHSGKVQVLSCCEKQWEWLAAIKNSDQVKREQTSSKYPLVPRLGELSLNKSIWRNDLVECRHEDRRLGKYNPPKVYVLSCWKGTLSPLQTKGQSAGKQTEPPTPIGLHSTATFKGMDFFFLCKELAELTSRECDSI